MAIIQAVVTEDALKLWPQVFIGTKALKTISHFKIGEGGWIDTGSGKVPRTPVSTLRRLDNSIQDLDAVVDPTRAAIDQRYIPQGTEDSRFVFSKALTASDFTFQAPSSFRVRCFMNNAEGALDNGAPAANPEYWEIGLFSDHPDFPGIHQLMVAYGTMPREIKTASRSLENIVVVTFSGT